MAYQPTFGNTTIAPELILVRAKPAVIAYVPKNIGSPRKKRFVTPASTTRREFVRSAAKNLRFRNIERKSTAQIVAGHRRSGNVEKILLTGTQTINFYPTPDAATPYTVRTVDDVQELNWDDNSPLNTEFDDFVVEFATIRLSAGNEYDMTQESQLLANIAAHIQSLLTPPPVGFVMEGYWK